jgi:hypothetical protein
MEDNIEIELRETECEDTCQDIYSGHNWLNTGDSGGRLLVTGQWILSR